MATDAAVEADIAANVDRLVERLDGILDHLGKGGNSQTVIHKSSMGGFVAGLAVATCVGSFFFTMYAARTLTNEMRDLTAWKDIYGRDLAVVKQYITQQKLQDEKEKKP